MNTKVKHIYLKEKVTGTGISAVTIINFTVDLFLSGHTTLGLTIIESCTILQRGKNL